MKRFFVIAVALFMTTIAMAQGGGGGGGTSPFKLATVDAWLRMLDTTFYWERLKLSELNVPATLTRSHLRRAWALGLAYAGTNESYDISIQNWMVRDHLLSLFFNDLYPMESQTTPMPPSELWYAVNARLRERHGINLDSVEVLVRGVNWYYSQPHDYLSERALEYFAQVAQRTPVIYIPEIEWTANDTMAIEIWISRNAYSLAAFRTILHGWNDFADIFGLESKKFSVIMERVGNLYSEFAIAGLTQNYAVERDFLLAKAKIIPRNFGVTYIFQHRPIISDATGKSDLSVWALRSIQRSFDRSDFNQNHRITISDAAMASRYILKNIAPSLPHLGDVNRNNLFDPDDPYIIFRQGLWGGGYGGGLGKIVETSGSKDSVTRGIVAVKIKEDGNIAEALLSFSGEIGVAKRFNCSISFNETSWRFESATVEQKTLDQMGGVFSENGNLNVLAYPEKFEPGKLLSIKFRRVGLSELNLKFKPLRGDNYFALGEDVHFEIGSIVTGVKNEEGAVPKEFALSQNYPNPFNPSTTISYSLPKESWVKLEVFDLAGRSVKTLVDKSESVGNHSISFEGSGFASGMYFYRIQAGEFRGMKKMILLK